MVKRIRCLFKGHKFLMQYRPSVRCYTKHWSDCCSRCNKPRGFK